MFMSVSHHVFSTGLVGLIAMLLSALALGNISLASTTLAPELQAQIQQNLLQRLFHDGLYARNLFRTEATREKWDAQIGEVKIFTRSGVPKTNKKPIQPLQDPPGTSYGVEQWRVEAAQYGDSMPTHMPSSYVAIASKFQRDGQNLGLQAAASLNELVRDRLSKAYLGGNGITFEAALAGATALALASLNGFQEKLLNGQIQQVSPGNPIPITIGVPGEPANTVVGVIAADVTDPFGPGLILLGTPTVNPIPGRTAVLAATRSRISRVGGGATVDALTPANTFSFQTLMDTVARLRANNVPPCSDGTYHVHFPAEAESQLAGDVQFRQLFQSLPDSVEYRDLAIGQIAGCTFYRNTVCPNPDNVGALLDTSFGGGAARETSDLGAEIINNNGVPIKRAYVIAGGAIYEEYIDEGGFMSIAGATGAIGEFRVVNNGIEVAVNGIRYIIRAPLDVLQQVVMQAWSFSGDWGIPSDQLTGNLARFKRCAVIEFAGADI